MKPCLIGEGTLSHRRGADAGVAIPGRSGIVVDEPTMNLLPKVDLSRYSPGDYQCGPLAWRALWYVAGIVFIESRIPWPSRFKTAVLRVFGARVGAGTVLKPRLRIKYPWFLEVGDHVWLGEDVWIDNLAPVRIGSHACLSQGACVLTGNHDYRSPTFALRLSPVAIGMLHCCCTSAMRAGLSGNIGSS